MQKAEGSCISSAHPFAPLVESRANIPCSLLNRNHGATCQTRLPIDATMLVCISNVMHSDARRRKLFFSSNGLQKLPSLFCSPEPTPKVWIKRRSFERSPARVSPSRCATGSTHIAPIADVADQHLVVRHH